MEMKTLYVSDLDGTLLRSDETVSDFTCRTVNALVEQGMLFSFATARSYITSSKVTRGISARIPMIVYNGAFVVDSSTGEILLSNFFGENAEPLLDDLMAHGVYPIVYGFVDGVERYSFIPEKSTRGMKLFNGSRAGDPRENIVADGSDLHLADKFCIVCIDEPEKLEPLYRKYEGIFHCIYHRDIYSGEQWLEFLPRGTSKSAAVLALKEKLGAEKLVVFGDGRNDIDLFSVAQEAYAMENAVEELKAVATGTIGSNNDDGVAKWLYEHFGKL